MSWSHDAILALLAAIVLGLYCEWRLARKLRNRRTGLGLPSHDWRSWSREYMRSLKP